jgi:hypothetical protein
MNLDELTFGCPERQAAEAAAHELHHELRALGMELPDIEVIAPCPACRRTQYTIRLGTLHPGEAREVSARLRRLGCRHSVRAHGEPAVSDGDGSGAGTEPRPGPVGPSCPTAQRPAVDRPCRSRRHGPAKTGRTAPICGVPRQRLNWPVW